MKGYIYLTLLFVTGMWAASPRPTDIWVVRDARALQLYDKYRQPVPQSRLALYPPYSPWMIVERDVVLADGFSRVSRVTDFDETFSIALNDSGNPRLRYGTSLFFFRNCFPEKDTLRTRASGPVRAGNISANPRQALTGGEYLPPGEVIRLLFRYKGYLYAWQFSRQRYIWIAGASRRYLEKTTLESRPRKRPTLFVRDLKKRVREYNTKYRLLAEHLQNKGAAPRPVPRWILIREEKLWRLTLERPELAAPFRQTVRLFLKEMASWVESYGYTVNRQPAQLIIMERHSG